MNVLALCSGYGGLELGLQLATHGASRGVCYVENPRFVERLMGTPLGWASGLGCSATEWSLWSQRMHFVLWYVERLNEGQHD
jgi:hypothetical protein